MNQDAKCAEAYLGKLMAELQVSKKEELQRCSQPFHNKNFYQKALRFGDDRMKEMLDTATKSILYRSGIDHKRKDTIQELEVAIRILTSISSWKNSSELITECEKRIAELKHKEKRRNDEIYNSAVSKKEYDKISSLKKAVDDFRRIQGWRDADILAEECLRRIEEIRKIEEEEKELAIEKKLARKK